MLLVLLSATPFLDRLYTVLSLLVLFYFLVEYGRAGKRKIEPKTKTTKTRGPRKRAGAQKKHDSFKPAPLKAADVDVTKTLTKKTGQRIIYRGYIYYYMMFNWSRYRRASAQDYYKYREVVENVGPPLRSKTFIKTY